MGKKKKKKKKRLEEEVKPPESTGPPAEAERDAPAAAALQQASGDQPVAEDGQPEPSAGPKSEERVAADQFPEDAVAPPDRPGFFTRLTSWLGGESKPAAAEAEPEAEPEPEPELPSDSVEEVAIAAEVKKDAAPSGEEASDVGLLERQNQEIEKLRGEKAAAESKVQALEAGLAEQQQTSPDLQKQVEELTRRLDAKDAELNSLRSQSQETEQAREEARRALSRLRDMEAALTQAEEKARELQTELRAQEDMLDRLEEEKERATGAPPARQGGPGFSSEKAAELYQQAITPLTVLVASADLLVMDPGLEPSLRETAAEMKTQSQALLELIKKYAGPGT